MKRKVAQNLLGSQIYGALVRENFHFSPLSHYGGDGHGMTSVVCLKPWPGLKDSLDIFPIQIEQEIKK